MGMTVRVAACIQCKTCTPWAGRPLPLLAGGSAWPAVRVAVTSLVAGKRLLEVRNDRDPAAERRAFAAAQTVEDPATAP